MQNAAIDDGNICHQDQGMQSNAMMMMMMLGFSTANKNESERREIDLLEDTSISFYESLFYKTCCRHAPFDMKSSFCASNFLPAIP